MSSDDAILSDVGVLTGTRALWQEKLLCDYTIKVDSREFKVHKVIIASVSDYFRAMLTRGMTESQTDRVTIEGFSSVVVSNMIKFIYTGQFGPKHASANDLLAFAVYIQFPAAIVECTKLLCNEVNNENCFDIVTSFKTYSLTAGVEQIVTYIKENLDEIVETFTPNELSVEGLLVLIDVWVSTEWELFSIIKKWLDHDYVKRKQHVNDLMGHVRFGLMTTEELAAVKATDLYTGSKSVWRKLVNKAEAYHGLPIHKKVLDKSEQSRMREEPLVMSSLGKDDTTQFYTLQKERFWKPHGIPDGTPDCLFGYRLMVNGYLIVLDKQSYIFDPRTRKWSLMASMTIPRITYALVQHEDCVYAIGGMSRFEEPIDRIEKYDFEKNEWTLLPSKLPQKGFRTKAGLIDGAIYVIAHGSRMDCYDIAAKTWESKAPVIEASKETFSDYVNKMKVMQLWQEEVLYFLDSGFIMRYYRPSTDQWSRLHCKTYVDTSLTWDDFTVFLPKGNTLLLLNFPKKIHTKGKIKEKLDLSAKWTFEGEMNKRSKKITEVVLHDFPMVEAVKERDFAALWESN